PAADRGSSRCTFRELLNALVERLATDQPAAADLDRTKLVRVNEGVDRPPAYTQPFRGFLHREQGICWQFSESCHHAALPLAEISEPSGMAALRLASFSAACQRARSATACSSRRAWSR